MARRGDGSIGWMGTRRRFVPIAALLLLATVAGCGDGGSNSSAQRMADQVERLRADPQRLAALLKRMPKGADLHSHTTGAAQTESLIDWGIADDLCVNLVTLASSAPPCAAGTMPIRDAETDADFYEQVLGAWSVQGFMGSLLERHAHFFATFGKFGAAAGPHTADIFVEQKREAARERIAYLELMSSFGASQVNAVGNEYLPTTDAWSIDYLLAARERMLADPRFTTALDMGQAFVATTFDATDAQLGCGTPAAEAACAVDLRLQVTGTRIGPRATVFAQFLYGFELAQRDARVVAVNLVGPEEDANSLAFYDDEMLAVGTLRGRYAADAALRPVHVSLHAGELIPVVLPDTPDGQRQLTFHIRRAVEVGGAERIGHGVDLEHERESANQTPETLLATMHARGVMVEISLTSNDLLLGVAGRAHPLGAYMAHGVPVALSTDDEGVLRTDLTEQYVRAVTVQGLDYFTLKRLARNALEYAFAPGASLWSDPGRYRHPAGACAAARPGRVDPSPACAQFLADNRRAALQWTLEADLRTFERSAG
ncbi:MAG: adenosine deaminase [bacterium]